MTEDVKWSELPAEFREKANFLEWLCNRTAGLLDYCRDQELQELCCEANNPVRCEALQAGIEKILLARAYDGGMAADEALAIAMLAAIIAEADDSLPEESLER